METLAALPLVGFCIFAWFAALYLED